ncbi:hypothetical protein CQY20_31105 [Mycolicibacterium agri]|uniref:Uncharacterized protein n=1 Tax=Mycolicibacterium agri TaxID=36811 RepID=A0A2A7MPE6_MYCAG|nr:hypothetical protein CQY20_31105 [Mycolicibacterium agri]
MSLNPLLANAASSQSYFVVLGRHDRVGDGDRVRANSVASSAKKFVPMLFTKKAPKKGADSPNAGSTQPKPAAGDGDTKDSGTSN